MTLLYLNEPSSFYSESKEDIAQQKVEKRIKFPNVRNISFSSTDERERKVSGEKSVNTKLKKVRTTISLYNYICIMGSVAVRE